MSFQEYSSSRRYQACDLLVSTTTSADLSFIPLITVGRQDLNASIMTGSDRIVNHTTFVELQWARDLFSPNFFVLAPGFEARSDLLTEDFNEILRDIHALQLVRDSPSFTCENTISLLHVDNQQAWIESRLAGLPKLSPLLECCHLAAYLATCMICCKVWRTSPIPVCSL